MRLDRLWLYWLVSCINFSVFVHYPLILKKLLFSNTFISLSIIFAELYSIDTNMNNYSKLEINSHLEKRVLFISATEYHLGLLKAKLARYRQQLLEPTGKAGAKVGDINSRQVNPNCLCWYMYLSKGIYTWESRSIQWKCDLVKIEF